MTASELITRLQKMRDEHGDFDVYMADWSECYELPRMVETVSFSLEYGFVLDA